MIYCEKEIQGYGNMSLEAPGSYPGTYRSPTKAPTRRLQVPFEISAKEVERTILETSLPLRRKFCKRGGRRLHRLCRLLLSHLLNTFLSLPCHLQSLLTFFRRILRAAQLESVQIL